MRFKKLSLTVPHIRALSKALSLIQVNQNPFELGYLNSKLCPLPNNTTQFKVYTYVQPILSFYMDDGNSNSSLQSKLSYPLSYASNLNSTSFIDHLYIGPSQNQNQLNIYIYQKERFYDIGLAIMEAGKYQSVLCKQKAKENWQFVANAYEQN